MRDEDEIASYVLSRIIVSCINDKQLIDRLTRYEAERAYIFSTQKPAQKTVKTAGTKIPGSITLDIAPFQIPRR